MSSHATPVHSPLQRPTDQRVDPAALASAFTEQTARLVVVDSNSAHHVEQTSGGFDPDRHVYLGWSAAADQPSSDPGEHHWFARRGPSQGVSLREADLEPVLADVVTAAAAVLAWHDTAPCCERCGAETTVGRGGSVRSCSGCGALLFPRQDPAIIIAVVDETDRLLLAHQRTWRHGRVSVLAGFVEAGESLEHTCGREVLEEVGLVVDRVSYVASQAWPHPRSLMVGFVGRATGQPVPDGAEIEWARWYERGELARALAGGELTLPGPSSLGRLLITAWQSGTLPTP